MIKEVEITKKQVIPDEYKKNLATLLERLNKFRTAYGKPMIVTSGYRSPEYNAKIGGAKRSCHTMCMACDFADSNKSIQDFIKNNPEILDICELWCEDFEHTKGWVHLDIKPRKNRIFLP
jgi:hypothetical protein